MPEYKSRINVRVRIDQQDWKKLADIKTKEEWKLDESVEEIFIIARGGFIKTDDWSVDLKLWRIWLKLLLKLRVMKSALL